MNNRLYETTIYYFYLVVFELYALLDGYYGFAVGALLMVGFIHIVVFSKKYSYLWDSIEKYF